MSNYIDGIRVVDMENAKRRALEATVDWLRADHIPRERVANVCAFCEDSSNAWEILSALEGISRVLNLTFVHKSAKIDVKSLRHNLILVPVDSFTTWHFQRHFDMVLSIAELHKEYLPGTGHELHLQAQVEALAFGGAHIMATYLKDGTYPVEHPSLHSEKEYRDMFVRCELHVCQWTKQVEDAPRVVHAHEAKQHASSQWKAGIRMKECLQLQESCLWSVGRRSLGESLLAKRGLTLNIGLWMSNKKLRSFIWKRFNRFETGFGFYAQQRGATLIPLTHGGVNSDVYLPMISGDYSGSLDIILQKDGFLLGYETDENSEEVMKSAKVLDSDVPVLDPPDQAKLTYDRLLTMELCSQVVDVPAQVVWGVAGDSRTYDLDDPEEWFKLQTQDSSFSLPAVAKPVDAEKHQDLTAVFNAKGLADLALQPRGWILQEYIPHNDILFKVSVIGEKVFFSQRPTLDLDLKDQALAKNENLVLGKISSVKESRPLEEGIHWNHNPPVKKIDEVGRKLRKAFGLDLFGIDAFISAKNGKLYVVDLNYFPSFVDVPNKNYHLMEFILDKLHKSQSCDM